MPGLLDYLGYAAQGYDQLDRRRKDDKERAEKLRMEQERLTREAQSQELSDAIRRASLKDLQNAPTRRKQAEAEERRRWEAEQGLARDQLAARDRPSPYDQYRMRTDTEDRTRTREEQEIKGYASNLVQQMDLEAVNDATAVTIVTKVLKRQFPRADDGQLRGIAAEALDERKQAQTMEQYRGSQTTRNLRPPGSSGLSDLLGNPEVTEALGNVSPQQPEQGLEVDQSGKIVISSQDAAALKREKGYTDAEINQYFVVRD